MPPSSRPGVAARRAAPWADCRPFAAGLSTGFLGAAAALVCLAASAGPAACQAGHLAEAAQNLRVHRPNAAWQSVERSYLPFVDELLAGTRRRSRSALESHVLSTLRESVRDTQCDLAAAQTVHAAPARLLRARADSALAEWTLQRFERDLAKRDPLWRARPARLDHVQTLLGPNAALVGWVNLPGASRASRPSLWVYVVRGTGPVRWTRLEPHGGEAALREATKFTQVLRKRPDIFTPPARLDAAAHRLFMHFVAPAENHLEGVDDLVVIQPGPLRAVPVEVLVDRQGRWLGDRFRVVYCASATAALLLDGGHGQRADSTWNSRVPEALFVADPEPAGVAARLAGSVHEIAAARTWFGDHVRVLAGVDACEEALLALAPVMTNFSVLHFATHAEVDAVDPGNCALVLAAPWRRYAAALPGECLFDGRWTAREVLAGCRLDADLVVLAGCSTGFADLGGTGGPAFSEAFLRAGARHVMLSQWDVDDAAAARLMELFYAEWLGPLRSAQVSGVARPAGRDVAAALGRAKRRLRATGAYADPWYWAGFTVIGGPH